VDAFHQYVMDRVYHTAWRELCEAMVKAGSLDEVIYVHETYLLSIQRQCFVVQEKLVMDHEGIKRPLKMHSIYLKL
jgi:gamma-tubulin complex component 5